MSEPLRITDLRDPVLSEAQQAAVDICEPLTPDLTVDGVLAAAARATGRNGPALSDFGPDDFRERLQVWLDAGQDAGLTGLGRVTLFRQCVKQARNRLRVLDLLRRHPEIHQVPITAPIVVTGLPRSGTTHLVNLIAADTQFRSLPLWESDEPVPVPGEGPGRDGLDPRFLRCRAAWETMQAVNPYVASWHPMNPEHIHEDLDLMGMDFSSYNLEWIMLTAPRWRDYYLDHDQTPHYLWLRTMLQVLQWHRGPDRWVLKCPQHLENLGPLLAAFPDATVVITQRDPVGAVQSAATMQSYSARTLRSTVDVDEIFEYWADRVERLLRAGLRDRHLVPAGRLVDVRFDDLTRDPMSIVNEVYAAAGVGLTDRASAQLTGYLDNHPRDKHGVLAYDLRGDFGITPDRLRDRYSFYLAEHPVRAEVT